MESQNLRNDIMQMGEKCIREWFGKHDVQLLNIVTFSMMVVEKIKNVRYISPQNAYTTAKELIPVLLDTLVDLNIVSHDYAESVKNTLGENAAIIDQFIPIAIEISKDPAMLQATGWVKKVVKKNCSCFTTSSPRVELRRVTRKNY